MKILHNHIGYEIAGSKHAVILGHADDQPHAFRVLALESGHVVFSGTPEYAGPIQRWRDWEFWTIDFDAVQAEGTYCIECTGNAGTVRTPPFVVEETLLERNTVSDVLSYFKAQRCSGLLDKADRRVPFDGDQSGRTVDAHGGWFDATGDYGKHLSHLCFSTYFNPQQIPLVVWSLFRSYDALRDKNNRHFKQYLRRLLDEAMFGADYLVRVKSPGGSFYITVSGHGPEKKPEDRRLGRVMKGFEPGGMEKPPTLAAESFPDTAYQTSFRSGAGVAIAALAKASTFTVSGDFENADYLKAAEDAFAYLDAHNLEMTNDGKENIVDLYCALLAATELFKATHKATYRTAADRFASALLNQQAGTDGQYSHYWRADETDRPFFHASDGGFPVVSLLNYLDIAEPESKQAVLDAVKKSLTYELAITAEVNNPFGYSRQFVQNKAGQRRTTFFFPHDTEVSPWWQGENARLASMAAAARAASRHFAQEPAFRDQLQVFAWNQLNWILGLNPFDMCMLDGSGHNNPPYHSYNGSYQFTNCPGGICNGITSGLDDEEDIAFHTSDNTPGLDDNWRWGEQWLPHAAWFLLAVALG